MPGCQRIWKASSNSCAPRFRSRIIVSLPHLLIASRMRDDSTCNGSAVLCWLRLPRPRRLKFQ